MSYVRDPIIWARAHYALSVKYGRRYYAADSRPPAGRPRGRGFRVSREWKEGGAAALQLLQCHHRHSTPGLHRTPPPLRLQPPARGHGATRPPSDLCNFAKENTLTLLFPPHLQVK
ncbi:unnamed protein product [Leptosia nina]|uniref:Uncharacterized protein n=1 Tax=Leptosia nina TaxID=320188 RepID=A0AAV1IV96_9NEOP